ncbi:MAG TPA: hypothetical protein VIT65_14025 [Microlunatus sp.]
MDRLRNELDVKTFNEEWAAGERHTLTEALRSTEIALTSVLEAAYTTRWENAAEVFTITRRSAH